MAMLVVAALAAYANAANAVFLFDGKRYIAEDESLQRLWPPTYLGVNARPLVWATFALNAAVGRDSPGGYLAVNVLVHLCCGLLLFGLVRRTLRMPVLRDRYEHRADWLAFGAALLWLVHPLQTQSVTYIYQRLESLVSLWILLALYCFVRSVAEQSRKWQAASVVACCAGVLSKELGAVAPVLVLWYDRTWVADSWRDLLAVRRNYYLALFAPLLLLAVLLGIHAERYVQAGIGGSRSPSSWNYCLTQSEVILHYVRLWFWPVGQCLDYGWPTAQGFQDVWLSCLLWLALVAGLVWGSWKAPGIGFLGGWFFLLLAPSSSIVPTVDNAFEHRVYLASAALAVGCVLGLDAAIRRRTRGTAHSDSWRPLGACLAVAALLLAALTHERNRAYHSELAMFSDVVAKRPHNPRGWMLLGNARRNLQDRTGAIECYRRSVELAPDYVYARVRYGLELNDLGAHEAALDQFSIAYETNPRDEFLLGALGQWHLDQRQPIEAIDYCRRSLEIDPQDRSVRNNLAAALSLAGRHAEAAEQCQEVLSLDPQAVDARVNLAIALAALGQTPQALGQVVEALRIKPDDAQAHATYSQLVLPTDPATAQMHMATAVRLNPKSPDLQLGMGSLLARDRPDLAIAYFREALRLRPNFPEAHFNLANALVAVGDAASAVEHLEAATKLRPEWEAPQKNLAALKKALARLHDAERLPETD
jgi:tetratricopeptide (TPR) repeat protein